MPGDVAGLAGETVVVGIALARLRWIVVAVVVVALVHDLGVIERRAANEHAIVAPGRLQVRGDLVDLGNQAGIEVAVAVVGVDVVVALVLPLHPPQGAVGQGGIERTGHLVVEEAEFDGLGLAAQQRQQPGEGEAGPGRRGAQPGLAVGDVHRELTPCGHALGAATAGGSPFVPFLCGLVMGGRGVTGLASTKGNRATRQCNRDANSTESSREFNGLRQKQDFLPDNCSFTDQKTGSVRQNAPGECRRWREKSLRRACARWFAKHD